MILVASHYCTKRIFSCNVIWTYILKIVAIYFEKSPLKSIYVEIYLVE